MDISKLPFSDLLSMERYIMQLVNKYDKELNELDGTEEAYKKEGLMDLGEFYLSRALALGEEIHKRIKDIKIKEEHKIDYSYVIN